MTDAENTLREYDYEAIRPIIGWPQWREDDTARICQLRGRSVFAYDPPPTGQRPSEGWSVAAIYPPYIALCAWRSHLTAWLDEQGINILFSPRGGCFGAFEAKRGLWLLTRGNWSVTEINPILEAARFPTRDAAMIAAALALLQSKDDSHDRH